MITTQSLIAFGLLSFVAAFVQTLTGFAFGLLLVGAVALTALMPLQEAAIIVSILTLVNAVVVLFRGWKNIAPRPLLMSVAGSIPMVVVGYALLEVLAENYLGILRIALGIIIIVSSILLIKRAHQLRKMSGALSFALWGAMGGIMSGLFSTAGPPLVFQFYRQPLAHHVIRETLVAVFAVGSTFRLTVVAISGDWNNAILLWVAVGFPCVVAATYLGRFCIPHVSIKLVRRLVVVLLWISGLSLILT